MYEGAVKTEVLSRNGREKEDRMRESQPFTSVTNTYSYSIVKVF
jgi:hypothetical protein